MTIGFLHYSDYGPSMIEWTTAACWNIWIFWKVWVFPSQVYKKVRQKKVDIALHSRFMYFVKDLMSISDASCKYGEWVAVNYTYLWEHTCRCQWGRFWKVNVSWFLFMISNVQFFLQKDHQRTGRRNPLLPTVFPHHPAHPLQKSTLNKLSKKRYANDRAQPEITLSTCHLCVGCLYLVFWHVRYLNKSSPPFFGGELSRKKKIRKEVIFCNNGEG